MAQLRKYRSLSSLGDPGQVFEELFYDSRSYCEVHGRGCGLAVAYYPPNTCHLRERIIAILLCNHLNLEV